MKTINQYDVADNKVVKKIEKEIQKPGIIKKWEKYLKIGKK